MSWIHLIPDYLLTTAIYAATGIAAMFIIWLMKDANAPPANPDETKGVTAGVAIFAAIALAAKGLQWYKKAYPSYV